MFTRTGLRQGTAIAVAAVSAIAHSGTPPQIQDVGPTIGFGVQQSASGRVLDIAVSTDGAKLYAATFSGVWRSDDGGLSFSQMTPPKPADGLPVANVLDVAIAPGVSDLVLAGTGGSGHMPSRDGVYRSTDGGRTWALGTSFRCRVVTQPVGQVEFAPDDARLAFAVGGCESIARSTDGGATWTHEPLPITAWHIAVAPAAERRRRLYAAGDGRVAVSDDGGTTWIEPAGTFGVLPPAAGDGPRLSGSNSRPRVLALEPGNPDHLYFAVPGSADGPSYYHLTAPDGSGCNTPSGRPCSEGSLWLGDFTDPLTASWDQLPGPPVYWAGSEPGGGVAVATQPTVDGHLVLFADGSEVHLAAGRPVADRWHRIGGPTADDGSAGNRPALHRDPYAIGVSADFTLSLVAPQARAAPPLDRLAVVDRSSTIAGILWLANGGGIVRTTDAGASFERSRGLHTLQPSYIAGIARAGRGPALYIGTAGNEAFFTTDGGRTWGDPMGRCGDCGATAWFADPSQPQRLLQLRPRPGGASGFTLFEAPPKELPNPAAPTQQRFIPGPNTCGDGSAPPCPAGARLGSASNASAGYVALGYRPIVRTLESESPLADGDYVILHCSRGCDSPVGTRRVLRTRKLSSIRNAADWNDPTRVEPLGDPLPCAAVALQAAGGHRAPTLFVGDRRQLYKLPPGASSWQRIVPPPDGRRAITPAHRASAARMFFVNPYDAMIIYILDDDGVRLSRDGGETFPIDASLDTLALADGALDPAGAHGPILNRRYYPLMDMQFDPREPGTRFAVGNAGVFMTLDGSTWSTLLDTTTLPGRPVAAYFDRTSNPQKRSLYVAFDGRSVVRIGPLPRTATLDTGRCGLRVSGIRTATGRAFGTGLLAIKKAAAEGAAGAARKAAEKWVTAVRCAPGCPRATRRTEVLSSRVDRVQSLVASDGTRFTVEASARWQAEVECVARAAPSTR